MIYTKIYQIFTKKSGTVSISFDGASLTFTGAIDYNDGV